MDKSLGVGYTRFKKLGRRMGYNGIYMPRDYGDEEIYQHAFRNKGYILYFYNSKLRGCKLRVLIIGRIYI